MNELVFAGLITGLAAVFILIGGGLGSNVTPGFLIDEINISSSSFANYIHLSIFFEGESAPVINVVINGLGYANINQNVGTLDVDVSNTILHLGTNTCQLRTVDSQGHPLTESAVKDFTL